MTNSSSSNLPDFLQTYDSLNAYIRETLDNLNNTEKGRAFAKFASKIIPISYFEDRFKSVEMGQDSRDGGVDLTSISDDNSKILYGQSKLTISKVEELDTIMSKFKNYYETRHQTNVNQPLFSLQSFSVPKEKRAPQKNKSIVVTPEPPSDVSFLIITLSNISKKILPDYEKSSLASIDFYRDLKEKEKIFILDGPKVLPYVQSAYRKINVLPSNFELHFESYIKHDNVYVGVLSAKELKKCYKVFGDALFLENIRLFLGYSSKDGRENVNNSIKDTVEHNPREMLARNNGITFKAVRVTSDDQMTNCLHLEQASIVNGCQTTMCIVEATNDEACVLTKIVEVADAWEVAKASNFQNKVDQIALEIANFMRPQVLQAAASNAGVLVIDKNESLYHIFDAIYQEGVRYDEIFYMVIGIFSKTLNNLINKNYTELRSSLLEEYRKKDFNGEYLFSLLLRLYKVSSEAKIAVAETYQSEAYKNIFQRFWKESKPDYRSLITILAAIGCVRQNIYATNIDLLALEKFFSQLNEILTNDKEKFIRYYKYAYETIAQNLNMKSERKNEKDIQRTMFDDLKSTDFNALFRMLLMTADGRGENHN